MRTIGLSLVLFAMAGAISVAADPDPHAVVRPALPAGGLHVVSGTIASIRGTALSITTRSGRTIAVDSTEATQQQRVTKLSVARPVTVYGHYLSSGQFEAWAIGRARQRSETWPPDR